MLIPRTRGALSGVLLIALGIWGGLIPLVGPYFNFGIGPDKTWSFTSGHVFLQILPGAAAVVGGLILLASANRATALLGGWLALAGGVWFTIGPAFSMFWNHGVTQAGLPIGTSTGHRTLEWLLCFYGLGAAITALAGIGIGRLLVRSVRDAELAAEAGAATGAGATTGRRRRRGATRTGRFARDREPAPAATADERTGVMAGNGHGDLDRAATTTTGEPTRRIE